ncbi:uncharacterized protein LOC114313490 [Camellia sinensis]|uniref:uncharacterized protein LOC114313490 n=1 Tax=Camellia sinensis TaxID=4442 RepID=UPI001036C655|nr:uncharacterized protein LOC114313490 [Camellia sinensis]
MAVRNRLQMEDFRQALSDCHLSNMGFIGWKFTWCNNRASGLVRERLDRGLVTDEWQTLFPEAHLHTLVSLVSDHSPILVDCFGVRRVRSQPGPRWGRVYRFEAIWLRKESCEQVVANCWNGDVSTANVDGLQRNIVRTSAELKGWSRNQFGHLQNQLRVKTKRLEWLRSQPVVSEDMSSEILLLCKDIDEVLERESIMWWVSEPLAIERTALDYFADLFKASSSSYGAEFLEIVSPIITEAMNSTLLALFTEDKLKEPKSFSQFRPISLCNVVYKIISKVLANRLKLVFPSVISESQCAFGPGRLLTNNVLIAFENFHWLKNRCNGSDGYMALKLDMSKAYDRVEWAFLESILVRLGFAPSKNVNDQSKQAISHLLGVEAMETNGKYLGMPTFVGVSKREVFGYIKTNIWKRLNGWKEKFLSAARRDILIKAVTQAIPIFIMSCFMVPVGLCYEIDSMISHFWRGQREEERKIHWLRWSKLCLPKQKGGLGFRSLVAFNRAMLAKKAWRLLKHPESLVAQLLKSWYFPTSSVLDASLGCNPSLT